MNNTALTKTRTDGVNMGEKLALSRPMNKMN